MDTVDGKNHASLRSAKAIKMVARKDRYDKQLKQQYSLTFLRSLKIEINFNSTSFLKISSSFFSSFFVAKKITGYFQSFPKLLWFGAQYKPDSCVIL